MRAATLVRHGLLYYWRSNLAVIAGVATAAAVLAGALGVGDSVRESLARSALARLGRTSHAVESTTLFREALADELGARLAVATAPVLSVSGVAAHGTSGRRAGEVRVYGVDARFWSLQDAPDPGLTGRDALLSPALHSELQAAEGATILLRLESMAEVPGSSLFGRRDAPGPSLRVVARGELPRGQLGEFSLHPARDAVRAVFVPLASLQRALGVAGRANAVVLALVRASGDVGAALSETVQLEDLGLRLRVLEGAGALQLESTSTLLNDATAHAAQGVAVSQRLSVSQALVHLATTIRSGRRELPYALVAALDVDALRGLAGRDLPGRDVLLLNDWAAQDLEAAPGAALELEYDTWLESGRLEARRAGFRLSAVVPVTRLPAARALVPEYPGITDAAQLSDWDPPFPVDLKRIRPRDEAYWDLHRTTPKAFLSLEAGQRLWGHRLGRLTALRFTPEAGVPLGAARERLASALRDALAPAGGPLGAGTAALRLTDVRAEALAAARGSTDFGEYFAYFSIFLVAAALLLAGLFFRLGIEQRQREVGLLGALGFSAARLRLQFLGEGAALAGLGMLSGMAGAVLYAAIVLWGLRRLWSGTLPTSDLVLHVSTRSLALGVVGVGVAALVAALWTLRDVRRLSLRALLAGGAVEEPAPAARGLAWPMAAALAAALVVGGARVGRVPQTAGFFGAGFLLLASAVLSARLLLGSRPRGPAAIASTAALGRRGAAYRPGRSVSCV
ncbi:MAG TPA: FtsX-like permease family protein, partial [Vicinamibacteria bacterium]|nr:FtsX-like permease family protein [Vicinamibacteria bacterium]